MQFNDSHAIMIDGTVLSSEEQRMYEALLEDRVTIPRRSFLGNLLFGCRKGELEVAVCAADLDRPTGYRFVSGIKVEPDGLGCSSLRLIFRHAAEREGIRARLLRIEPHPVEFGHKVAIYQLSIPHV